MASQQLQRPHTQGHAEAKTEQLVDSAKSAAHSAVNKAENVAQNAQGRAQQQREQHGEAGFLQQKGEQVAHMAQGAIEGVKNTLGIGHDHNGPNHNASHAPSAPNAASAPSAANAVHSYNPSSVPHAANASVNAANTGANAANISHPTNTGTGVTHAAKAGAPHSVRSANPMGSSAKRSS